MGLRQRFDDSRLANLNRQGGHRCQVPVLQAGERVSRLRVSDTPPSRLASPYQNPRSVHREVTLGLSVHDVEEVSVGAEKRIAAAKGYVRIPVSVFDDTIDRLGKPGRVEARNLKRKDLTDATTEKSAAAQAAESGTRELETKLDELLTTPDRFAELHATGDAAARAFMTALRVPVILLIWTAAFAPIWLPLAIWWRVSGRRRGLGLHPRPLLRPGRSYLAGRRRGVPFHRVAPFAEGA